MSIRLRLILLAGALGAIALAVWAIRSLSKGLQAAMNSARHLAAATRPSPGRIAQPHGSVSAGFVRFQE